MRHPVLPAILSSLIVLASGAASAVERAPVTVEEPVQFEADDGTVVDAFRGVMQVPENRADPGSRLIDIVYIRFPSTGDSDRPIVYLAGGPGGSGIATAKWRRFPLFMAMRAHGDVIALDQRGTGESNDMPECTSSVTVGFTERLDDPDLAARHRAAAQDCAAFWQDEGIDLAGYTTRESVQDIDDLRAALGAETVALWGISYGSHLALAALNDMEEHIDRVVLASVEGLDQTVKMPAGTDAYFERLQQAVNSDPASAALYPDIEGLIRRVHAALDEAPLTLTVGGREVLFQRHSMQQVASAMIADPENAAQLLGLYLALDHGQTAPLEMVLGYFIGAEAEEALSFRPMPLAMDIASGISPARLEEVNRQAQTALLRDYLNFPMPQLDGMLGLDLGDDFRTGPVSDVPVLVFSGTLDGRTYPDGQREAVAGLSGVTIIEVTNAGHNLFMSSPEITRRIDTFIAGEAVSSEPVVVPLPSFIPPGL